VLVFLNNDEFSREENYQSEIFALNDWEQDLDAREQELDAREEDLDAREEGLDDREADVDDKEERANAILTQFKASEGTPGEPAVNQVDLMARALTAMKPAEAAIVLNEMIVDQAVYVCERISASKLGPILDKMDPDARLALFEEGVGEPPEPIDEDEWSG